MKWIRVWVCVVACAGWFSARPARAASGPTGSQGRDRYGLSATKILVTGTARANLTPSGSTATDPGAGTMPGREQSRNESLAAGGQNRPGSSTLPGTIACSALEFSVSVRDQVTGKATGRASTTPIVCRKAADQAAVQLLEEAVTARRIPNLTLSWQNQIAVKLTEAEVTSVQFKVDNGAEVVEVTFAYQKVEVEHTPSGTHAAL